MTVRWTVRAAEPTVAFSPQRKGKTVWFKSHPRNHQDTRKKSVYFSNCSRIACRRLVSALCVL